MNVVLLTIGAFFDINHSGVYTDLIRKFADEGHNVYVICSREKRYGLPTELKRINNIGILHVKIGNITKTNLMEKGISTLFIGNRYKKEIKKYFKRNKFDLVLYSTPPITLVSVVKYLKRNMHSYSYLMLKDIFPQNSVDLGILKKNGILGLIHWYFRENEKRLYKCSDKIGCMSAANVEFIMKNNPELLTSKIEICPNTIDVLEMPYIDHDNIHKKYQIPENKLLLLYGGNVGRPQNVDYIIDVIKAAQIYESIYFILCGSGTDFYKVEQLGQNDKMKNLTILDTLEYNEYSKLVASCHIGLIFLDYRFTIPNFPSRLLDYMNFSLPVLAATDCNTDIGKIIEEGKFGWWCESNRVENYLKLIERILFEWENEREKFVKRGVFAKKYLELHYTTDVAYKRIVRSFLDK